MVRMQKEKRTQLGITLLAILLGIVIGALFMLFMGYNPLDAYSSLFGGIFGNLYNIGETIRTVTPLIFTGLAVAFAFRTGLFNIGVEGQFIIGQLAAVAVATTMHAPVVLHALLALIAAAIAGGIWAGIAGFLKAKMRVHEVITTIMLNYIALGVTNYTIRVALHSGTDRTPDIFPTASLAIGWLSNWFGGSRMNWGIIIALFVALLVAWVLNKTVLGYELRAVGFNSLAAEYAGMNVSKNIILSMMISGAISAIGGAVQVLGVTGYLPISAEFSGVGFDGIAVALIGGNNPLGVIFSSLLFGGLEYGSETMQRDLGVPTEIIRIVMAIIIFLVAANGMIRVFARLRMRKGAA